MGIFWRLFAACAVVILVTVTWFVGYSQIRSGAREYTLVRLTRTVGLLAAAGSDALPPPEGHPLGTKVAILDEEGQVLSDSGVSKLLREDWRSWPELETVRRTGGSSFLSKGKGGDDLAVAIVRRGPEGANSLILAVKPLFEIRNRIAVLERSLLFAALISAAGVLAASLVITYRIARPIAAVAGAARRIAAGELDVRAPATGYKETKELARAFNRMARELQEALLRVEEGRARLEAVLGGMEEAVLVLDREGRATHMNLAARKLFGPPPRLPRPLGELPRGAELKGIFEAALESGGAASSEIALPAGRIFDAHAYPISEPPARDAVVVVLHDITKLRRLERIRQDFVANVSHELRTPLAGLTGSLETALDVSMSDPEAVRKMLDIALRQSIRLDLIMEDLLELSRLESGKPPLERELVPAKELLEEVASRLQGTAREFSVELLPPEAPEGLVVWANAGLLHQAVSNLLDNAIKYNRPGGSAETGAREVDGAVEITVSDTGIGIPAEHRHQVFERFYRVDKARSKELGGTGLGLSIVKHIVQLHGGEVRFESEPGRGSTFTVVLPAGPGEKS